MTLRMYLHKPKQIFICQVDLGGNQPVYPQYAIAIKNISLGTIGILKEGMTLLLGTAPGKDDYGRIRFKHMSPDFPTNVIHVSRFSHGTNDGEGHLVENSYITILEEFRVWAKVPRMIGAVVYKDGEYWGNVNSKYPPPCANAGTGVAGTIGGNSKLSVTFYMGNSFKWDAGVGVAGGYMLPLTQWQWEIGDGTLTSGTLTSQSITVDFPAGFRYVYLKAWGETYPAPDAAVPNVHIQSVPVFARNPAADLSTTAFQIRSHTHTFVGQEITAEFYQPLLRTDYPDGAMMMLWDDAISYDPTQRYHMLFIGWHNVDAATITAEETSVLHSTTLTFLDVGRRLELLPGFSQVIEYNANPTTWSMTRFPTLFYYFWFILFWHSTAIDVTEFLRESPDIMTMEFAILGSERGNLYDQCQSIAEKVRPDHHFTCHHLGILHIVRDPMIQDYSARLDVELDNWTENDWTSISFPYLRPSRLYQIRTMAIISRKTYIIVNGKNELEIIACRVPGEAPGQGMELLEVNEGITLNQTQLNMTEGNRYARLNSRYGMFNITIPYSRINYLYDISRMQWVKLTISGSNITERELAATFNNKRGICHEMSIQYDYTDTGLVRTATFTWEMETWGMPAETEVLWPDVPTPATLEARANARI